MQVQAQRMSAVTLLPHGKECGGRGMHCVVAVFVAPHRQSACACLSGLACRCSGRSFAFARVGVRLLGGQRMAALARQVWGGACAGRGMHCVAAGFVTPHR